LTRSEPHVAGLRKKFQRVFIGHPCQS
jgi:hypothetical protein